MTTRSDVHSFWQTIPEYRDAFAQLNLQRDAAFLVETETICGVHVRSMTLRDFIALDVAESPFIIGGIPSVQNCIQFLWLLSPDFTSSVWRTRRFAKRTARRLKLGTIEGYLICVAAIAAFVAETMADAPGGCGDDTTPPVSWAAAIIADLAFHFGWPENVTLGIPLKRLHGYRRCIRMMTQSKALFPEPTLLAAKKKARQRLETEARN